MGKRGKGGSGGQRTSARSRAIAKQNQQQKEDMWDAFEKCKVEESQQLENMKNDSTNTAGSNSGSEDELELPPFPLAILNGQTEDKKLVKKLTKEGLIKEFNMGSNWPGLCLHPEGGTVLSPSDTGRISESGLALIDNSDEVPKDHVRALPWLVAANPRSPGESCKLNCVEQLAAALYICGYLRMASVYLANFSWGPSFIQENNSLLEKYRACKSSEEIAIVQNNHLKQIDEAEEKHAKEYRSGENVRETDCNLYEVQPTDEQWEVPKKRKSTKKMTV